MIFWQWHLPRIVRGGAIVVLLLAAGYAARPGEWSEAAEVRHDEKLCVSYRARVEGSLLVIRATIEPGWHTFAMDNKQRAMEKLAGKPSLGIDHPTEIVVTGLDVDGPWYQSPPQDFSKPDLRWFSWGFERQATFAAKIHRKGTEPVRIGIKGQTCTESTCKNIDVSMSMPPGMPAAGAAEISLKDLVQVR